MKMTDEVKSFLSELNKNGLSSFKDTIDRDLKLCERQVVDNVLANKIRMEYKWSSYSLSNIYIDCTDDMLSFSEKLDLYALKKAVGSIIGSTKGIIFLYEFTVNDAFGNVSSTDTLFHVIVGDDDRHCLIDKLIMTYE